MDRHNPIRPAPTDELPHGEEHPRDASPAPKVPVVRCPQKVHAVDVGHGQLAWKLRNDERVAVHERTNARHLNRDMIEDPIDLVVCDASFIGLEVVLPAPLALASDAARLIALIKPQFQVGRANVGKGGVVRDPDLHRVVCERIEAWLSDLPGWHVLGITQSPIKGPEGNIEFLIAAEKR